MAEKIDHVSENLVDQANKEKERADRAEKTCQKVTGQLGQEGFKRRKADEANWAHLREQNEALTSQNKELILQNGKKDRVVEALTAKLTKAHDNMMDLAFKVTTNKSILQYLQVAEFSCR